jgi:hypothetical protein
MNIDKELKEWVQVYCHNNKTDWENLHEVCALEIRNWLKEDGFSEKEIDNAINNYSHFKF